MADNPASFRLLNDLPVDDEQGDRLGMDEIAASIAEMLTTSCASPPITLAIDAGWGAGKSSLLRRIEAQLANHRNIESLRFNAWTAESGEALDGLIKSVLQRLDPRIVRRSLRKITQQRTLVGATRLITGVAGRVLHVGDAVDELWRHLTTDARSRNELRDAIRDMLGEWAKDVPKGADPRALVVFIDDLDRCSDDVVQDICNAIKLYLDVPGLIFVIACDQSVLARGVSTAARGGAGEGRAYLEKIIQVAYRLPPPQDRQVEKLVRYYAEQSNTTELIDDRVTEILVRRTGRNPRRIKRIINSFVLTYRLDPTWRDPQLGGPLLVIAMLLQHLYPDFYALLLRDEAADPIGDLLTYVDIRTQLTAPGDDEDWWDPVLALCTDYGVLAPKEGQELAGWLPSLEKELPEIFPALGRDRAFIELLTSIGDFRARRALRTQLINRPPADRAPDVPSGASLTGRRIVCVDDDPESLTDLRQMLEDRGASVTVYDDPPAATRHIIAAPPDALISDITRGDDRDAGFGHVAELRAKGYTGPVIFFTARVTPERRRRADELDAVDVLVAESAVVQALEALPAG